jgi:hypothetical protein
LSIKVILQFYLRGGARSVFTLAVPRSSSGNLRKKERNESERGGVERLERLKSWGEVCFVNVCQRRDRKQGKGSRMRKRKRK